VRTREPGIAPAPQFDLADLGDPAMWSRAIREESARAARFGHPITVVIADLPRLDGLSDRFGSGIADQVTAEAAQWLASESRAVDRVAWLGGARFGILLPETDEIAAGAWVERVRGVADDWLEATGLSIRLSLGWASPTEGGDVAAAAIAAEQRMHDAERRSRPSPTIIARVSRPPDFPRPPRRTSGE
jgi:diguanylate cyclase (GGDEF)-like protein